MGTYKVRKGNGNRVVKEGKTGFLGEIKRTSPGKVIFTIRKIQA